MSKTRVLELLHRILYDGSPHVGVVLRGNGTVVLPHGGHKVADDTCVARESRSSRRVPAKRKSLEIGRAHV